MTYNNRIQLEQYEHINPTILACNMMTLSCTTYLLGNIIISKKILLTRKIMVMHSNERVECCPRTLVDRKRKRYDNAVDVVIHIPDPTDPITKSMAPPRSAHVQLDGVPQTIDLVEC